MEDLREPLVGLWDTGKGGHFLMRDARTREPMIYATAAKRWVRPCKGWQRNDYVIEFIWACTGIPYEQVVEDWEDILRLGAREWRWRRMVAGCR